MGRNTEYLKMYLPNENDYYRVEEDQNQNFEKLDTKLKEIDNTILKIGDDKQDKIDMWKFYNKLVLSENIDLNDFVVGGNYTSPYWVAKVKNSPSGHGAFILTVKNWDSKYISQEIVYPITNSKFIRTTDAGKWSSWEEIITDANIKPLLEAKQNKEDDSLYGADKNLIKNLNRNLPQYIGSIKDADKDIDRNGIYAVAPGTSNVPYSDWGTITKSKYMQEFILTLTPWERWFRNTGRDEGWVKIINEFDLNNKTAEMVSNNIVENFPLSKATKGNTYRRNNRYYLCVRDYTGETISFPNSNFERVTISNNTKKIENIFENTKVLFETTTEKKQFTVPEYNDYKLLIIEFRAGKATIGQDDSQIVLFNIGQSHITVWSSEYRAIYNVENGNFKKFIDESNTVWIKRIIGVVRKGG